INYSFYDDLSKFKDCSVYKNIKFPCLIVHGDKDTSIPLAHSINLSNNINGSRLKIIKNAGHKFSTHENSKKLKNEVVSFLIGLIK
ncbi:MAG: alpha/beta fold hydrolase, partial [Candidatus Woesearchaeota archaeon]